MDLRSPTAFVAITDRDWLDHLSSIPGIDEVNFWQPSPHGFAALRPGEPFLFKLHERHGGRIAGIAFFLKYTALPVSMAWEAFGEKNGAGSLPEMRRRIERYRKTIPDHFEDYEIGCIMLSQPIFLANADWIEAPEWHTNIQAGRRYVLDTEPGRSLWARVEPLIGARPAHAALIGERPGPRYGPPIFVQPRLGQGSFQAAVLDAYARRCAVTGERVVPALEAAHIRPYAEGGDHRIDNGLLLRRDVHALFDRGYITVTPELKVTVSARLKVEFDNGDDYAAFDGADLRVPKRPDDLPNREVLDWHNRNRFVA